MKITAEKLKWLQENKEHGEVASAVKQLNPKNNPKGISNTEALSIINGRLWGQWGKAFTDKLEEIINARLEIEKEEKLKYSNSVN